MNYTVVRLVHEDPLVAEIIGDRIAQASGSHQCTWTVFPDGELDCTVDSDAVSVAEAILIVASVLVEAPRKTVLLDIHPTDDDQLERESEGDNG